ncbi:MAG: ABC transporter substrate-binding protein [Clostridia bacterium]|nr:ABC transporter substrate-binding protein [Clostridia bacterium]
MKRIAILITALLLAVSCAAAAETVSVYALQGPTGIGMAGLMENNDGSYDFTLTGAPDAVTAAILSGDADIAAVPTNLAAVLYNKTNGGIRMLAVNTLGVLYILENGNGITCAADLAGKTIYATGQGSTPEYVLNYVLEKNGIKDSVTVEYVGEHAALAAMAAEGKADIVMLPEPFVTNLLMKKSDMRTALDMTELFNDAAAEAGTPAILSMGCVIARTDFINNEPESVDAFLKAYQMSAEQVNADAAAAAELAEKHGVMPNAGVAEKAIPNCHIVFIAGEEMKSSIQPFLQVLCDADPKSVGGKMPDDGLFFLK